MVVLSTTAAEVHAEGVIKQTPSTKLFVNDQEVGTATLYVTQHNVIWGGGVKPEGGPAPTISLLYPQISMHGVQREPTSCLFMLLDYDLRLPVLNPQQQGAASDPEEDEGAGSDEEYDPDNQPVTQLRFVPPNESDLLGLYAAMSEGQALHPDPEDVYYANVQDEDEAYMDGEEFDDDEQFEDAEESEANPDDAANHLNGLHIQPPNGNHHPGPDNGAGADADAPEDE